MNILKITLAMASVMTVSCTTTAHAQTKNDDDMKSVIVYFTHSGNTELAAEQVAEVTGAKMIRLLPEQPYSSEDVNWVNRQSRCTQEHLNRWRRSPCCCPCRASNASAGFDLSIVTCVDRPTG